MYCKGRHNWMTPRPTETRLECMDCPRTLDRASEITPNMRASIVNSIEINRGPEQADYFRAFFGYGPLATETDRQTGHPATEVSTRRLPQRTRPNPAELRRRQLDS